MCDINLFLYCFYKNKFRLESYISSFNVDIMLLCLKCEDLMYNT